MLPKNYRLKKKTEFSKVYQAGKSVANKYLILFYKPTKGQDKNRIAFAVSKKMGTAVERNRIKRRMREAMRPLLSNIKPNYDLIFIARIKIKGISFDNVEKNMVALLQQAGLTKRDG